MGEKRNFTSSSDENFSEDGWLSWTVEDFYGTTVLCEKNPNGSTTSSVVINDTFSIPNDQYQSWCTDDENNGEDSLGFYISSFFLPAVGILCNSIVCLVLVKGRRFKRNFSNFHIFNLALTDLFFRCCFAPVALEVVNRSLLTSWSCKLLSFLNFSTLAVTFTLLAGIAVDRYLNICYPFKAKLLTWKHSAKVIWMSWLFAMVFSSPVVVSRRYGDPLEQISEHFQKWSVGMNEQEKEENQRCYFARGIYLQLSSTLFFLFAFILPLVVTITSYGFVVRLLWRRSRNRMINGRVARSKFKVIKMLVLVVMVYILSWGPFLVILLLTAYDIGMYRLDYILGITDQEEAEVTRLIDLLDDIALLTSCCSSVANPLIFAFYSRNFRHELRKTLYKTCNSSLCGYGIREIQRQSTSLRTFRNKSFRLNNHTYKLRNQLKFLELRGTISRYTSTEIVG